MSLGNSTYIDTATVKRRDSCCGAAGSYTSYHLGDSIRTALATKGTVNSVGLSAPSAFTVSGSPVTSSGTLTFVGAGTIGQYIRGDGSLATFPGSGWLLTGNSSITPVSNFLGTTDNKTLRFRTNNLERAVFDSATGAFVINSSAPSTGGRLLEVNNSDALINGLTVGLGGANVIADNTNTVVGISALRTNTSGLGNTAIGYSTLTALTTGINNTVVGYNAGLNLTTGKLNTLIGPRAGLGLTAGADSNTIIGGTPVALASNLTKNVLINDGGGGLAFKRDNLGNVTIPLQSLQYDTLKKIIVQDAFGNMYRSYWPIGNAGTVQTVSVVTANGISGSVSNPTTTPAITLSLGAITPSSVVASGNVSGSNLSGTNTGDQTITLTGGVTGSGTGSFATTVITNANLTGDITSVGNATNIGANKVTLAMQAQLAANSVIGNSTGSTATPTAVSLSTNSVTSSIPFRDASANINSNNFNAGYTTTTTASATSTLTANSTYWQYFTGNLSQSIQLPVASTMNLGQSFFFVNNSTGGLTINASGSGVVKLMDAATSSVSTGCLVTCILTSGTTNASWNATYIPSFSSGAIPVTGGGTGLTGLSQGDILYGSATNTLSRLPKSVSGASTTYLSNAGTSNNPAWNQVSLISGVTGTLPVTNGGIGATTLAAHGVVVGNSTSPVNVTTAGTLGQVLTSTGPTTDPVFGNMAGSQVTLATISRAANYTSGYYSGPLGVTEGAFSSVIPIPWIAPCAGTLKNFYIQTVGASSGSTFYFYKAALGSNLFYSTSPAITIASGLKYGSDVTNTISCSAGDLVITYLAGASFTSIGLMISAQFEPTTP